MGDERERIGIGVGFAGEAHNRPHPIEGCERVDEPELSVTEPVWQVEHDLPDITKVGDAGTHHVGCRLREVVLVVIRRPGDRAETRRDARRARYPAD